VALVLVMAGMVFVLSSFYRLGITGTFLGDYFGILMKEKVTGFPFIVLENPMYMGSTLAFLGRSLLNASPIGLVLTLAIYICYKIALLFEEPFTNYIYSHKRED